MDKTMIIWDILTGKMKKEYKKHTGGLTSIIHIRDLGNSKVHVAVGSEDKKIYIWDLNKGTEKPAFELIGHTASVDKLLYLREFSTDLLASGSKDKSIKLWKVIGNKCQHTMIGHNDRITSLLYMASYTNMANSKNIIISGSADKSIKSWSLVKGKQEKTFTGANNHLGEITCLIDIYKFKDKNDVFATGSKDGTIKLWEYLKESCVSTISAHEKGVNIMIGLKEYDTSWIATGGADKLIKIWDIYKDSPYQHSLEGHEGEITCLVYLKEVNIELIASGSEDGTIKIWNFVQCQMILSLDDHNSKITFLVYLDGYYPPTLVSSCTKNMIKIWKISK